jgi:hypothetical protein
VTPVPLIRCLIAHALIHQLLPLVRQAVATKGNSHYFPIIDTSLRKPFLK